MEILIATALSLLLLAVVAQNYLSVKKIYRFGTQVTSLNENIRFADFILWQNIMQAGFAGCRKISDFGIANSIYGYDDSSSLPNYLLGKVIKGTDVIVVAKASADVTKIANDISAGDTSFKVIRNLAVVGNKFLLISDCENANLFHIKDYHNNVIRTPKAFDHSYKVENTEVRLFEELAFFIGDTGRLDERKNHIYSLYISTNHGRKQELVSGVSGMWIYYGVNSNKGGIEGKYLKAHEISNANLWDKINSVIIEFKMQGRLYPSKKMYIMLR